jgi:hypothetical protein
VRKFIANSSALARVLVGWVFLLSSSSCSLLELLVGFPMANPFLLPLLTGVHERLILRTSALRSSEKFASGYLTVSGRLSIIEAAGFRLLQHAAWVT